MVDAQADFVEKRAIGAFNYFLIVDILFPSVPRFCEFLLGGPSRERILRGTKYLIRRLSEFIAD
jgi:hypothetical protein